MERLFEYMDFKKTKFVSRCFSSEASGLTSYKEKRVFIC